MKIVFIILNYNTFQETKDCVLSIESKVDTQNYKIVIVDNLSTDDSADKIEKFIEQKNNMILIRNTENLGFAKGNNVGIEYAKRNYKPQFIVVLNSDTELIQNDLVEKLEAMTSVCSVGLDMIAIPGDTKATTISGIIADEMALGMVNQKTTAVRIIPVIGKGVGDTVQFGGLLGYAPIMPVNQFDCSAFVNRGGRIPAPIHSFKN